MSLVRRSFLKSVGSAAVATPFASRAFADPAGFAPTPGPARTFELVTRVEIADPKASTRVWVPVPSRDMGDWFWSHGSTFSGNAASIAVREDRRSGAAFVEAVWNADAQPLLEVTSHVSTRDRAVDLARAGSAEPLSEAERAAWLRPTRLMPVDGIVKQTSDAIVAGKRTDLEKVRAIYEWVVDNTHREAATPGCGEGDAAAFLRSGSMGGKCADINGLFVALARAAGVPARDIYGIRVAPSKFGYRSLGANTADVTRAQHCRAEAWITGVGWLPVDPADVRKVALEEPPGHLDMASDKVVAARRTLFGAWETNWLAYNNAQDVRLPGSSRESIAFLMYPQAEVGGQVCACYDQDRLRYSITAREIV
jgi:transglutaminase-like putative cysteine protease